MFFCQINTLFKDLSSVTLSITSVLLFLREQREKEEIEKYRMERPKIQQQFSDLKVRKKCLKYGFYRYDVWEADVRSAFLCSDFVR